MVSSGRLRLLRQESGASSSFSFLGGLARAIRAGGRHLGGSENLDPSGPVLGLVRAAIETHDFRAAQTAGEADRQDRLVAQAPQIVVERGQHREQVVGENRFLLDRRSAMGRRSRRARSRCVDCSYPVVRRAGDSASKFQRRRFSVATETGSFPRPPSTQAVRYSPTVCGFGGQGVQTLAAQPGRKSPPFGVVASGCFRHARCGRNRAPFRRAPRDAAWCVSPRRAGRFRLRHPTLKRRLFRHGPSAVSPIPT